MKYKCVRTDDGRIRLVTPEIGNKVKGTKQTQKEWLVRIIERLQWVAPNKVASINVGQRVFQWKGTGRGVGQEGIVTRVMAKRVEVTWKEANGDTYASVKERHSLILLDDKVQLKVDNEGRRWFLATEWNEDY